MCEQSLGLLRHQQTIVALKKINFGYKNGCAWIGGTCGSVPSTWEVWAGFSAPACGAVLLEGFVILRLDLGSISVKGSAGYHCEPR